MAYWRFIVIGAITTILVMASHVITAQSVVNFSVKASTGDTERIETTAMSAVSSDPSQPPPSSVKSSIDEETGEETFDFEWPAGDGAQVYIQGQGDDQVLFSQSFSRGEPIKLSFGEKELQKTEETPTRSVAVKNSKNKKDDTPEKASKKNKKKEKPKRRVIVLLIVDD